MSPAYITRCVFDATANIGDDVLVRAISLLVLAACGNSASVRADAASDAAQDAAPIDDVAPDVALPDAPPDAPPDSGVLGAWSAPVPVFTAMEDDPTLTADLLEMLMNRNGDIYASTRASVTGAWSTPALVAELSSALFETSPELSSDGLRVYFASRRSPTLGVEDIWTATRASRSAPWSAPVRVVELSSPAQDLAATALDTGTLLVMSSSRTGTSELYMSTRANADAVWSTPVALAELSSGIGETDPMLSADGLTIYFATTVSGGGDIMMATRASVSDPFGAPAVVDVVSDPLLFDADPWVSADGRHMFFERTNGGTGGIWEATR